MTLIPGLTLSYQKVLWMYDLCLGEPRKSSDIGLNLSTICSTRFKSGTRIVPYNSHKEKIFPYLNLMAFHTPNLLLLQISERPQVPGNLVREMSTFSSACHCCHQRCHTFGFLSVYCCFSTWGEEGKALD